VCKGGGEAGDPRDLKAEQVEARAKRTVASAQQQVVRNKVQQSPVKSTRLLTNLPLRTASAKRVARFYRKRWTLETAFQHLEAYFQSEINTLGYPKAALFGFCLALVAYNMLAVVMAAWRSGHGAEIIDQELSLYYVASDIAQTSHGMMIAIPEDEWRVFSRMRPAEMVATLSALAQKVCLKAYRKSSRGPKKPRPKREGPTQASHVSTAKLLRERKVKAATP
jgi:Transposase DDE domain